MKKELIILLSSCIFILSSCNSKAATDKDTTMSDNLTTSAENITTKESFDSSLYKDYSTIRLSSFNGDAKGTEVLKMKSPYTDTYTISFKERYVSSIKVYNDDNDLLIDSDESFDISLDKDEIVYLEVTPAADKYKFDVSALNNKAVIPFDINRTDTIADTDSDDTDPLETCAIEYVKRNTGMYVYSNCPEAITDSDMDQALTRDDITGKEVMFTFEHGAHIESTAYYYYGYQVRNTGTTDLYITVKNIGYQISGGGTYYGEAEWENFYNNKFYFFNKENWTDSQLSNYDAYYGFLGTYNISYFEPTTYRIPAGSYMYVLGGTTKDSYNKYNVNKTADKAVTVSCQNGAVLFETTGSSAEASFYVYTDPEKIQNDTTSCQGYVVKKEGSDYQAGRCSIGYDDFNGVIDMNASWRFNDLTPSQALKVSYTNYYQDDFSKTGEPYSSTGATEHFNETDTWYTNVVPDMVHLGVGSDLVKFTTVDKDKNVLTLDYLHYDGLGLIANFGNWMCDYQENYSFTNSGDNDREVTVYFQLAVNGCICACVRDENGNIVSGTSQYVIYREKTEYGDEINDPFKYTVTVKAHSTLKFTVEYNLMANSCGTVVHQVTLE